MNQFNITPLVFPAVNYLGCPSFDVIINSKAIEWDAKILIPHTHTKVT